MVFIVKCLFFSVSLILLSGCQLGYIARSAYNQASLMRQRVPLDYALENYQLTEEQRQRILLAIDVRKFMKSELGLDVNSNYSRYVQLDREFVSYAVNASRKDSLKAYKWSFPIIGSVPYKAYFKKQNALDEAKELEKENLDTFVRGVTAYSTLGWFEDPLLSSMLKMREHQFVNTLIHETVHANLYIEGKSKFNERVASFLGQLGAEAFYKKQGRSQELAEIVSRERHDELLFSRFITSELANLRSWYQQQDPASDVLNSRETQFNNIKNKFATEIEPQLKTQNYVWFSKAKLNNAFLLLLELYNSDHETLDQFAAFYERDFNRVFDQLKTLEDVNEPEVELKSRLQKLKNKSMAHHRSHH